MLKGVIFDMDGVLVDNADIHIEALEIFFGRLGVDGWQDKIMDCFGMGSNEIWSMLLPPHILCRKPLDEWTQEKEAVYREIYESRIKEVAGLTALLKELTNNGIRCAVGSSACIENVNFVLDRCHIGDYFTLTVCGDDVTRCKPDPEIYLTAASKLGLEPSECLVFEDAKAGIKAARNAGMKVVALATSLTRGMLAAETDNDAIIDDFTCTSLAELQKLF